MNLRKVTALGLALGALFSTFEVVHGEYSMQSLNDKTLTMIIPEEKYSFLIAGHIYGTPGVLQASTFLANIDPINESEASFLVLLGDIYYKGDKLHLRNFIRTINQIDFPVFNAPGNHCLTDRRTYMEHFGNTFGTLRYGTELFIFMDSELDKGNISGEQLVFLMTAVKNAIPDSSIKNVFVFSHKLIWSPASGWLKPVFDHLNSQRDYPTGENFKAKILPHLIELSQKKNVYCIAGDIGCPWSLPLFFEKSPEHDITYAACGLGDTEKDAMIKVSLDGSGRATFQAFPLSGQELEPLETYNTEYWRHYFGVTRYGTRAVRVLKNKIFYLGVIAGVLLTILALSVVRSLINIHR